MLDDCAGGGVVAFAGKEGVFFDLEADVEEWGKGVGELGDAEGANDADESAKCGDQGADYEGEGPVDGDEDYPEDFADFGGEDGEAEEFDEDVVVDDWGMLS